MWGRKCSLCPEHLISLPLGVHDFTHSLYIHYITEFVNFRTMFMTLTNDSGSFAYNHFIIRLSIISCAFRHHIPASEDIYH